jgi:hypothetical protein
MITPCSASAARCSWIVHTTLCAFTTSTFSQLQGAGVGMASCCGGQRGSQRLHCVVAKVCLKHSKQPFSQHGLPSYTRTLHQSMTPRLLQKAPWSPTLYQPPPSFQAAVSVPPRYSSALLQKISCFTTVRCPSSTLTVICKCFLSIEQDRRKHTLKQQSDQERLRIHNVLFCIWHALSVSQEASNPRTLPITPATWVPAPSTGSVSPCRDASTTNPEAPESRIIQPGGLLLMLTGMSRWPIGVR